jgi:hypothetical protein
LQAAMQQQKVDILDQRNDILKDITSLTIQLFE